MDDELRSCEGAHAKCISPVMNTVAVVLDAETKSTSWSDGSRIHNAGTGSLAAAMRNILQALAGEDPLANCVYVPPFGR